LQAAIAEERDLDGGVDRQAPAEQALDGGVRPLRVALRPDRHHILMDGFLGQAGDGVHSAIGRERRASRQGKR
jgi:hypothetical protein